MIRRLLFYCLSVLTVALVPGPDNCFVLAQSAAYGTVAGLWVTAGLMTGLCVHITLTALGLASVVSRFPKATDIISLLGSLYLMWVAANMWSTPVAAEGTALAGSAQSCWLRGIVLNLSNPKVILFFIAFLPGFLPEKVRSPTAWLLLLGALFIAIAFGVMSGIALAGGSLADLLRNSPNAAHAVSRGSAVAVAAIAVWIFVKTIRSLQHRKAVARG